MALRLCPTFELSGRPAVGAPLERGVRHQCAEVANWKLLRARHRQRRVLNVLVIIFAVFNIVIGIKAVAFHEGPSARPIEGFVDLEH